MPGHAEKPTDGDKKVIAPDSPEGGKKEKEEKEEK